MLNQSQARIQKGKKTYCKLIEMALNCATVLVLILFCTSAADARTKLGWASSALAPASSDSLCASMVETQGYACQEHTVTTEDGYILGLQRMPTGRSGKAADKPPVLLQHGIMADGADWFFNPPSESLACILADNGFDVWIANTRGTKYSLGHTSLTPNDQAYWEWSWDELAAYDLAAFFQYVYDQTNQQMHYVGHSLGTLTPLAAFSQGKLVNMMRSAALLCPIAYLGQMPSTLARLAADTSLAEDLYWAGVREFVPDAPEVSKVLEDVCEKGGLNCSGFMNMSSSFSGQDCCVNSSRVDIFLDMGFQPTSTKNVIHLAQMIRQGSIAMYDYEKEDENMKHYGQPRPPVYNMSSIPNDVPMFLGHGGQDLLSDVKDVETLMNSLKDHDKDKLVELFIQQYSHLDFVFGENAYQLVYDPLMTFFANN